MGKRLNKQIIAAYVICQMIGIIMLNVFSPLVNAQQLTNENLIMMIGNSVAYINGEIKAIDSNIKVTPITKDKIVMVPVKFLAEALGATVSFDSDTSIISIILADKTVTLIIGENTIKVGDNESIMDAQTQIINDKAMAPIKALSEALGKRVFWNKKGMVVVGNESLNPNNDQLLIEDVIFKISGDKYWSYNYNKDFVPLETIKAAVVLPEITKEMVMEAFKKNDTKQVHPRLIVNQQDIDRMTKLIEDKDEFAVSALKNITDQADRALKDDIPSWQLDTANLRVENLHIQSYDLPLLGLAFQLTSDKKYAKKAWDLIEAYSNYKDWGAPRHFLDAGVGTSNIAIGYDLIYNYLKAPQRQLVEDAIKINTIDPGLKGMESGMFWTVQEQNWNGICHTGIRLGAYTLFEKDPEFYSKVIAMALNHERLYIKAFEPFGQSEEGQGYFDFGFGFAELGFEGDVHILGTDFGLTDTNGLKNAGWFPQRTSGPIAGISTGDNEVSHAPNTSRHWFAKRFHDVGLAKIIFDDMIQKKSYTWRDLLFYDPELLKEAKAISSVKSQMNSYVPAIEIATFRSAWDSKANFIDVHGGFNNASHGHNDAGQFDIQSRGKYFIMGSLGKDSYQYPGYFDATLPRYEDPKGEQTKPGRLHMYRLRTEGKSCVVINGDGLPDIRPQQDELGLAKFEQIVSKPQGSYAVVDLTDPYKRDVKEYKRGIMLDNNTEIMTVQDEITTQKDTAKVWWLANTPAKIYIQPDGKSAILELDGAKMWVGVQSPANAKLKEIPATYLPGESFPLSTNSKENTRKLAIELPNVSKVTVTVNFIPLESWQDKPEVTIPPVKQIKSWNIAYGHLLNLDKPMLTDIKVNGESIPNFKSDYHTYTYTNLDPIDSENPMDILPVTDQDVKTETKGNVTTFIVTDKNDSTNQSIYVLTIKKTGLPQKSNPLTVTDVIASATPEIDHTPQKTIDGSLESESRWSAEGLQWIQYDLGSIKDINYLGLNIFSGALRAQIFSVQTSSDGNEWTDVFSGRTSGSSSDMDLFTLTPTQGRYVKLICNGNTTNNWNSILETKIYGK